MGGFGPDRIARTVYDAAGQVTQVRTAVGTADEAAEASSTYRPNGQVETVTEGENNRTTYAYDGHDRLVKTFYPVATKGANASNPNAGRRPRNLLRRHARRARLMPPRYGSSWTVLQARWSTTVR